MSRRPLAVILAALMLGGVLRFANLGALQMSADEGATWAAAAAPSIHDVILIQQIRNAGKLPLHDLMLHEWIAMFGDGLVAMRALSALCGLATILLMVPLTREVFHIRFTNDGLPLGKNEVDMIAALAALICAASLVTIKYQREARMYGLLLAIAVAHLWVFLRALRKQTMADYVVLGLLTSALVAVNLVTISMLVVEGIWLLMIFVGLTIDYRSRLRAVFLAALAMLCGIAILTPALYALLTVGREAMAAGKVNWLVQPPWWEPLAFFNKATGSVAFPVMFAIAAWGVWRASHRARGAITFALLVMWAPPLILVTGSFVWRPMFMERYAIYSFPAFFILIALGIWECRSRSAQIVAATAVVSLALGHVYSYSLKNHDVDWREAARVAQASLGPDQTIAVSPQFAVEVVRYYMYPPLRNHAVGYDPANPNSAVAILSDNGMKSGFIVQGQRDYPHMLLHARGVVVLSR